ncbi:MAG: response regulator [Verrucomicrobiae bacterium]|nr:response regulator [Verrucomicrobiae bacterium]
MKTVLFVDDDPIVVAVYKKWLERNGLSVEVAKDGLAALKYLENQTPDIVVLDLMMPNVSGVEVLKFMRADKRLKDVPVVVFSNAYMTELAQEAMAAGATKSMPKAGCTPSLLIQCVQDLLAGEVGISDTALLMIESERQTQSLPPPRLVGKPPPEPAPPPPLKTDTAEQAALGQIRAELINNALSELAEIRKNCAGYLAAPAGPAGVIWLKNLYQCLHFTGARASLVGFHRLAQLLTAFEALVFELIANPAQATHSTLHTIRRAMECVIVLFSQIDAGTAEPIRKARVLVVDDDPLSNRMVIAALQRAKLDAESVTDPRQALEQLQSVRYDLVMIDIVMPGMSGFELCQKLRRLPGYADTPVIFITVNEKFLNWLEAVLSGGNEIIAKPVQPLELALKATTVLIQHQLSRANAKKTG